MFAYQLFSITIVLKLTIAVGPCQTPNGQNGDCKLITNCQLLYAHFKQGQIPDSTAKYLRESACGFEGVWPKVCCPIGSFRPPTKKPDLQMRNNFNLLPNTTICGIQTASKITGGTRTGIDEYPWLVLLEYRNGHGTMYLGCGGALIHKRWVLTARHCLKSNLKRVRLGEYNIQTDPDSIKNNNQVDRAPPVVKIDVDKIIHHTPENDIGLVRLKEEASYSDFIRPICLPYTNEQFNRPNIGDRLVVAGWGRTENGPQSNIKLQVTVPIKPSSDYREIYENGYNTEANLHEKHICAGGEKGKDSCNGDSGGPLMDILTNEKGNNNWYAVGLVSLGPRLCAQKDKPSVYVKVAEHVPWILENIKS